MHLIAMTKYKYIKFHKHVHACVGTANKVTCMCPHMCLTYSFSICIMHTVQSFTFIKSAWQRIKQNQTQNHKISVALVIAVKLG